MQRFTDAVVMGGSTVISSTAVEQTVPEPSIHPKAIRPVGALHCTLGVMSLDRNKLARAVEVLEALDVPGLLSAQKAVASMSQAGNTVSEEENSKSAPASLERPISPPTIGRQTPTLRIDLKGLVSMHAPQKTSILYTAPADVSERLYPFCLAVQKAFAEAGYMVADDRELKLHATIVNTIYAKGRNKRPSRPKQREETPESDGSKDQDRSGESSAKIENFRAGSKPEADDRSQGHGPNANAPLKIDATALLEKFKDFIWAENVVLDRIAICEMGAKKIMDAKGRVVNEEYTEVASVPLPAGNL